MSTEKRPLEPWMKELFFEENVPSARRPSRAISVVKKLATVAPQLFAFVFCNFSAAYPRVTRHLRSAPDTPVPTAVTLDTWPHHPTRGEARGLSLSDASVSSLAVGDALSGVRDLVFAFQEMHRVLVPGGAVEIGVGEGQLSDPTAVRVVNADSVRFFTTALVGSLRDKAQRLGALDLFDLAESSGTTLRLTARKSSTAQAHPRSIDIGSGSSPRPGYDGIDFIPMPGVSIVRDVERHGLPFADSTIERVNSAHFLEHVGDLVFVMNEIHRVCCHDAIVDISVPSLLGPYAAADPTHRRLFNARTFSYFERGEPDYAGITKGFEILNQKVGFSIVVQLRVVKDATETPAGGR
jgi:predicted SAM-dependent methyltransferase